METVACFGCGTSAVSRRVGRHEYEAAVQCGCWRQGRVVYDAAALRCKCAHTAVRVSVPDLRWVEDQQLLYDSDTTLVISGLCAVSRARSREAVSSKWPPGGSMGFARRQAQFTPLGPWLHNGFGTIVVDLLSAGGLWGTVILDVTPTWTAVNTFALTGDACDLSDLSRTAVVLHFAAQTAAAFGHLWLYTGFLTKSCVGDTFKTMYRELAEQWDPVEVVWKSVLPSSV
jgi:hypothetical protein